MAAMAVFLPSKLNWSALDGYRSKSELRTSRNAIASPQPAT
jgi:hypothetical protein